MSTLKQALAEALTEYTTNLDEIALIEAIAFRALRQWFADEGLVVVPRGATQAMSDAFYHSLQHGYPNHRIERQSQNRGWTMQSHFVWDTMIAAAPDVLGKP
jgi:hypothetical protein